MREDCQSKEAALRKIAMRNRFVLYGGMALLLLTFVVSMNTGFTKLAPMDTLRTLFGGGSAKENLILFEFRLPRIAISVMVGAGLALSGCLLQGVAKNPLAEPGLLGIHAGAGLMMILYVLLVGTKSFLSLFTLPFLAVVGAGAAAVGVYQLAYKKGEGIAPMRLILMGIAVQAGLSALMTLLVVKLDDAQFQFVAGWQAGGIWGDNGKFVLAILPWLLVLVPYALSKARVLDVLHLGDSMATSLGVEVQKEKRALLAAAVTLAASCVAVSGSIPFVGLIAPHLARRLVGPKHVVLLPVCALAGAVLVSAADTLGRVLVQPSQIPAGILAAILGAPYFLYLLTQNRPERKES